MASQLIGRCTCPWCLFGSAHVKRSEKCLYMFCPECGSQHYARTERQEADLMAKTRVDKPTPGPTPTGIEKTPDSAVPAAPQPLPTPEVTPTQPAPARRAGLGLGKLFD